MLKYVMCFVRDR